MNEPRRLSQSGGLSQRLLDSASIDRPSAAARRRAEIFAGTAGAFSSTTAEAAPRPKPKPKPVKTFVTWIAIGAAASVALAVLGAKLLDSVDSRPAAAPQGTTMAELPVATAAHPRNPDISAERTAPEQHAASVEEARAFEVARAAITRGDNAAAITALNAYDTAFPNGALKPDAMALRVQALQRSGKTAEARKLADELKRKYPTRLLAPQ
jgi:hypothetical protein